MKVKQKFTDRTFVDGSGVIVREDKELSQCGLSVVSVDKEEPNEEVDASENRDGPPKCGCTNANNTFHKCSDLCDGNGCDGSCMRPKPDQKCIMGTPKQAVFGPLHGNDQTTPRAELMAILLAVVFGKSPQRIVGSPEPCCGSS